MERLRILTPLLSFLVVAAVLVGCAQPLEETPAPTPIEAHTPTSVTEEPSADTTLVESNTNQGLYKQELGPHEIMSKGDIVLRDDTRDKDLQIRVTWPDTLGKFPVIVWSHGLGGNKDLNQPLVNYWVSHGYVLIQINHSDSRQLTGNPNTRDWRNRPEDIIFVFNNLEAITVTAGIMGKLDQDSIGMGGHSFGAYTTQLIGGVVTNTLTGIQESHADPHPTALLMISPQGTGPLLSNDAWRYFDRPAMMITGSKDTSPTGPKKGQTYEWRLEAWQNLPPGNKYLVFIEGATHSFGGISGIDWVGSGPDNKDHVNYVRTSALAFWDAYLNKDISALSYLSSENLVRISENEAWIETK